MRLAPRSLFGRLLAISTLATLAALLFAGFAIGHVLERFVTQGLDQRLDAQIAVLSAAIEPDGAIDRSRIVLAAPYDRPGSGWGWRIDAPGGTITSPTPPDADIRAGHPPRPPHPPGDGLPMPPPTGPLPGLDHDGPRPFDGKAGDVTVHGRVRSIATTGGTITITAAGPRAIVDRPLRQALTPLLLCLLLLGVALTAATLVQLRLGLKPLGRLKTSLAAVRAGQATQVPRDQPTELAPLAAELNALLDENAAALATARANAANLAHGLKTPLATLSLGLAEPGRDPDGSLAALAARIDQAIRHHLGRARTATGAARVATPLAPALAGLIDALARLHADRRIAVTAEVDPDLALAVDRQDLDELLGNLLDNAWRWAGQAIRVAATIHAGQSTARIAIEDDGPGIPEAVRAEAIAPGRRLDERGDGHGFGLPIARELAELYGGSLALDRSSAGGLAAIVTLPLARD